MHVCMYVCMNPFINNYDTSQKENQTQKQQRNTNVTKFVNDEAIRDEDAQETQGRDVKDIKNCFFKESKNTTYTYYYVRVIHLASDTS